MKKRLTLAALILQGISVLLLFMPWMYNELYWKKEAGSIGVFDLWFEDPVSFFGGMSPTRSPLSMVTLAVMILAMAVMTLAVMGKGGALTRYGLYASPLALVMLAATVMMRTGKEVLDGGTETFDLDCRGKWELNTGWMFYVVLLVQIAAAVLCVLVALNKVKDKDA